MKALNKLARQLKPQPVKFQFWPLTRPLRIVGFPDAFNQNDEDGSSQTLTDAENQDATKITFALADSRIYSSWTMVSFL